MLNNFSNLTYWNFFSNVDLALRYLFFKIIKQKLLIHHHEMFSNQTYITEKKIFGKKNLNHIANRCNQTAINTSFFLFKIDSMIRRETYLGEKPWR